MIDPLWRKAEGIPGSGIERLKDWNMVMNIEEVLTQELHRSRVLSEIMADGVAIVHADPDLQRKTPRASYSIGAHFRHPEASELFVFGLSPQDATVMLRRMVQHVLDGQIYKIGIPQRDQQGNSFILAQITQEHVAASLPWAVDFYSEAPFSVLQVIRPDQRGKYPWQKGCSRRLRANQPLLFDERHLR